MDLRTCSCEDLDDIYNIGLKTANFFILHTRENAEVVALDVHILHFLKDNGYDVPRNTPSSPKLYKKISEWFLTEAKKSGKTLANFDLMIWRQYAGHNGQR